MAMTREEAGQALTLHPDDDVAVALRDLPAGVQVNVRRAGVHLLVVLQDPVPLGHKFALATLAPGQRIRKYGQVIGEATSHIEAGAHVHVHNMASLRARGVR
jgi:hypothetical protein